MFAGAVMSDLKEKVEKALGKICGRGASLLDARKPKDLSDLSELLEKLAVHEDPIHTPQDFFDPADARMLGRITSVALLLLERHPFSDLHTGFYGAGVYAIYYCGDLPLYKPISGTETPIYIGSAEPTKDKYASTVRDQGTALLSRLRWHARNIGLAENLEADHFRFRYLVVKSGLQKTAEDCLISFYKPLWNKEIGIMHGFGKHGDSAATRANKRSPWDTMHPGRGWAAESLSDQSELSKIEEKVAEHFSKHPPHVELDLKQLLLAL